jgi:hypothetical protein
VEPCLTAFDERSNQISAGVPPTVYGDDVGIHDLAEIPSSYIEVSIKSFYIVYKKSRGTRPVGLLVWSRGCG